MGTPFCIVLVLAIVPTSVFRVHVFRIAMLVVEGGELRGVLSGGLAGEARLTQAKTRHSELSYS
jgi:hypothetical protein